jgi:hypothetical protein
LRSRSESWNGWPSHGTAGTVFAGLFMGTSVASRIAAMASPTATWVNARRKSIATRA